MAQNTQEFNLMLQKAADIRGHLCQGLTYGLKMAQLGLKLTGMADPEKRGSLVVYVENDKCQADAIQVATRCSAGSRRLRMLYLGKSAASFIDGATGLGVRVMEKKDVAKRAKALAVREGIVAAGERVEVDSKLERKILMNAFEKLPAEELFDYYQVKIVSDEPVLSPKHPPRAVCAECGEEVREAKAVTKDGKVLCRDCAEGSYYQKV